MSKESTNSNINNLVIFNNSYKLIINSLKILDYLIISNKIKSKMIALTTVSMNKSNKMIQNSKQSKTKFGILKALPFLSSSNILFSVSSILFVASLPHN